MAILDRDPNATRDTPAWACVCNACDEGYTARIGDSTVLCPACVAHYGRLAKEDRAARIAYLKTEGRI